MEKQFLIEKNPYTCAKQAKPPTRISHFSNLHLFCFNSRSMWLVFLLPSWKVQVTWKC